MEGRGVGLGGGNRSGRRQFVQYVRMYAMISTEYRAVVVIKVLMTTPIAPMRARVESLNTNLGSTRTAKTVKMNSSCQLSIIHSRVVDEE